MKHFGGPQHTLHSKMRNVLKNTRKNRNKNRNNTRKNHNTHIKRGKTKNYFKKMFNINTD
jgi:hypothetical protein